VATTAGNIPITDIYDFNRDGKVDANDQIAARNNPTNNVNAPQIVSIQVGGPFAPEPSLSASLAAAPALPDGASPAGAGQIETALADLKPLAGSAGDLTSAPSPLAIELETDLNGSLSGLAAADTPLDRAIVTAADDLAHDLGVDEQLLDELVAQH
jgi:hypothetical protein